MAFLFAGFVFCTFFGTIIGSVLGFGFAFLFFVVVPLFYKLVVMLCRGFGCLLGVR